ncbi:hypothetical protein HYH03_004738 [Edaphochlamys debaryana]|uniref:Carbonic anhydrase n=1 Tax=Edaphochlamys debaryana TaxID=47281 RepID=A0A835Y6C1_9CHLO|nr:hypothetical protein HYH03_004738 [Edaphochlamys debaryana]|eukprot:KAG2497147.1 hypothetical protein HYH03_004738 [Edaphochlamys debaryana]
MIYQLGLLLATLAGSTACIFKYGSNPEGLEHSGYITAPWGYGMGGLDWEGVDKANLPWDCKSGTRQSPIHLHPERAYAPVPEAARSLFDVGVVTSNGSNVQVINNGHTIQLEWADPAWAPNLTVALPNHRMGPLTRAVEELGSGAGFTRVQVTPVQFHIHTHSEHFLAGAMFPAEIHIVCRVMPDQLPGCGSKGCFTVVGVMLAIDPDDTTDNPFLAQFWSIMPLQERTVAYLPPGVRLNLSDLLPANRSYFTYAGSLTTPPCTEGILWHLMMEPLRISYAQYEKFILATGDNNCSVSYPANATAPPARVEALPADAHRRHLHHHDGDHGHSRHLHGHDHDHGHHHNHDHDHDHGHDEGHQDLGDADLSHGGHGGGDLADPLSGSSQARRLQSDDTSTNEYGSGSNTGLSSAKYTCTKQGVGNNFRLIQPTYNRAIYAAVWPAPPPTPLTPSSSSSAALASTPTSSPSPQAMWKAAEADQPAAEAGAIFGAIIGSILGAALVALVAVVGYRHLKKKGVLRWPTVGGGLPWAGPAGPGVAVMGLGPGGVPGAGHRMSVEEERQYMLAPGRQGTTSLDGTDRRV